MPSEKPKKTTTKSTTQSRSSKTTASKSTTARKSPARKTTTTRKTDTKSTKAASAKSTRKAEETPKETQDAKEPEVRETKPKAPASQETPAQPETKQAPAPEPEKKKPVTPVPAANVQQAKTVAEVLQEPDPSSEDDEEDENHITMKPPIVVKELATKLGCKPFQLIHELMEMNVFATLNQSIEEDLARKICEKRGFQFNVEKREKGAGVHKPVEVVEAPPPPPVKEDLLESRPPVVTFMGHVDHGKTSLLDCIRQSRVTASEAGGITQHIGAYTVTRNGQSITFLDTPGHQAFTAMRARGANITDIVVIVVAADDGLMPQTREAIQHAKAAGVSIMVAINKIDLPGANPDNVKAQLQEVELTPEEWGGDTICVEVSAIKKTGIEKLIELIQLQSEVLELKAQKKGSARGVVVESQIEQGRGATATVLVTHGTLKVGDSFICDRYWGKVKALVNDQNKNFNEAGPSTPAKVIGFTGSPVPGEEFLVTKNEKEARQISGERSEAERLGKLQSSSSSLTLENLFAGVEENQKKTLPLVLKADVQGSLEAIVDSLKEIKSDKVDIHFILSAVGPITVSDVQLSKASNAVIIGFNTKTEGSAANEAKKLEVQIKLFSIIYELLDQVKDAMTGILDPELRESQLGIAVVKKVFELSKFPVAGCMVQSGRISRNARARVLRRKQPIYDGGIHTLKRFQDDANEVRAGLECGIRLGNFNEYEEDDIIECYTLEKVAQEL